MLLKHSHKTKKGILFAAAIVSLALISSSCVTGGTDTASSSNANSNSSMTPATSTSTMPPPAPLEAREPDTYSITETITIQPTGSTPKTNIPPLQFMFAKMGADRRLSFKLPDPVGEVIYLEKDPLKYLIFPSRKQYVELDPQELGFTLGDLLSPASVIDRLKSRAPYEDLGTEDINGRQAIKYRFKGSADTHTSAGTAQADSILYVDQETGLPLRSEIEATSTSGAGARVVTSTDSLQLVPAPDMFEPPAGMKKVSSAEVKQQVQNFISGVRVFVDYLRQQAAAASTTGK
jgi:hypothetical protein